MGAGSSPGQCTSRTTNVSKYMYLRIVNWSKPTYMLGQTYMYRIEKAHLRDLRVRPANACATNAAKARMYGVLPIAESVLDTVRSPSSIYPTTAPARIINMHSNARLYCTLPVDINVDRDTGAHVEQKQDWQTARLYRIYHRSPEQWYRLIGHRMLNNQ